MLLRLAYLGVTNAFAMLRLLPMSDHEKDVEIRALRHQVALLERQLNGQQVRFHAIDRAFLASLLRGLALADNLIRPGGSSCATARGMSAASPDPALWQGRRSLRHDDRLCCYDWRTWV
ncbi:hypothetical protein OG512_37300 [Streptomyces sp. NBC_01378]|uniref:hypothetical protein n=1 Tax=Streptomyces sp. NBC_01378 TaxID=2903844 RepID=UPI003250A76C